MIPAFAIIRVSGERKKIKRVGKNMFFCNVSCANIYREASFHSEVDTQVLMWEALEPLERKNDFVRVRCEDGYEGWLNRHQLAEREKPRENVLPVTRTQAVIWADVERKEPLADLTAGGSLLVVQSGPRGLEVELPDGRRGWVGHQVCVPLGGFTRENLTRVARGFMGLPYHWGGKSGKGVDCSGLVQLSHKLLGRAIRRDSPMQYADARPVSDNFNEGEAGDLLFFAESGTRITHVAIRLDRDYFIHARGRVRINSSREEDALYDPGLAQTFVEVRTFF